MDYFKLDFFYNIRLINEVRKRLFVWSSICFILSRRAWYKEGINIKGYYG